PVSFHDQTFGGGGGWLSEILVLIEISCLICRRSVLSESRQRVCWLGETEKQRWQSATITITATAEGLGIMMIEVMIRESIL
ncbi:hypothetical protein LINPERPRIM_LOCUS12906, partial [Linum perenne]